MPKKIIKKKPMAYTSSDARSDSGYLLPKYGLKKNAGAYENRGKSIRKHQRKNRDFNNYQYTRQAKRA